MEAQSVHSSQADVWYLKEVVFGTSDARRPVKIITQNFNGYVPSRTRPTAQRLFLRQAMFVYRDM